MRGLAVTSKTRSQALPNLPTTPELGYPDVTGDNWQGLVVPAGTPKQIIAFLHDEIVKIVALPDIRERLAVLGFEPVASSPEEFAEHVKVEFMKWAKVIKASNIKADEDDNAPLARETLDLMPHHTERKGKQMTLSTQITTADRSASSAFDVIPTGAALAAEMRGVDLRYLDDRMFGRLVDTWHQHSVLLVRGQSLSDQELIAFSRRFGDLDWAPIQENGRRFVEGLPEIYIVSNVKVDGEAIGSLGDGEAVWHTDMSYLDVPPKASMLYSLEVPPQGGNTSFCSMYAIYDALPGRLKERISSLKIKHDGTYNSGGYVRQGVTATEDPLTSPGAVHPLVCTHPDTNRRMLYLGRRRNAYLVGLELADSEALLDELWSFVDRPEFAWEHVWRVGDLVMWDNRCTMHRRDAFDPKSRRIMHRTQVKGEQRPA